MKNIIVDANAFLRYLLNDIPEQKTAFEKLLIQAQKSDITLIVSQITIFEIAFILEKYYQVNKKDIIDKLKSIISTGYLEVDNREIFLSALNIYSQENISLVDCFLISRAKGEKAQLFTFDKKLKNL